MYRFSDIIEFFGGAKSMGEKFRVTPQRVHQWGRHGTPASVACQIEVLSARKYRHNRVPLTRAAQSRAKGSPSRGSSRI